MRIERTQLLSLALRALAYAMLRALVDAVLRFFIALSDHWRCHVLV